MKHKAPTNNLPMNQPLFVSQQGRSSSSETASLGRLSRQETRLGDGHSLQPRRSISTGAASSASPNPTTAQAFKVLEGNNHNSHHNAGQNIRESPAAKKTTTPSKQSGW